MNRKVHVACNFNCLVEAEGLITGRDSQIEADQGPITDTGSWRWNWESWLWTFVFVICKFFVESAKCQRPRGWELSR